jgi:hypothetical protein
MPRPSRDDILDALALIRCAHEHDATGAQVILDYGDPPWIAAVLATIARDLVGDAAALVDEDRGDLVAELARRHIAAYGIGD